MNDSQNKSQEEMKNEVLEKIRHGQIRMRGKLYFTAQIVLVVFVATVALVLSVFVLSFAFFSLHESGELFLLGFGARGLVTFLQLFPWFYLIIAAVFVFLFEYLMRHFKFSYRRPILKVFLTILILVFAIGFLFSLLPVHSDFLNLADKGDLPIIGQFYENINILHTDKGEYRGAITNIFGRTITITHNDHDYDADDGTWTVILPVNFDANALRVGDRVYVLGDTTSGVVQAYGLKKF